jgi:hypothetical protein
LVAQIKEAEPGGACSTHRRNINKKYFGGISLGKRPLGELHVEGRLIIKLHSQSEKQSVRM